jgi:RNA polymerase sigma factor (sigma-70 family)
MQPESDAQLLRAYAERGAEAAFTELVHRHTNLVYSAAWRQVDSAEAAAEIAQNVFIGLARGAQSLVPRLAADASLAGWLCRSARNLSLNHRRDEFRRQTRERQAMEQIIVIPDAAPDWNHLRRVLDDVMAELDEPDYDALVLRYFQQQDFRAVGVALGVSDDTAQKRVARALEKLRDQLSRRGISTPAAALSIVISANAVQAAPAGLAATISTAALLTGTAVHTSTIIAAIKTIAMTTLQKTLVTVTVAALAGAGIYEARQAAQLREQNQTLQQSQAPLAEQILQLQRERDVATNRLAGLADELAKANNKNLELLKLRGELGVLRQQTNELGRLRQENKKLLAQFAAQSDSTNLLSVEDQFTLRQTHVVDAMTTLLNAMKNYAAKHNGQNPGSFDQLIASGDLETSNLAGNLGLDDFELMKDGAVDQQGKKVILSLRVPIQRPGKQSVIVLGAISDDGVTHTEIWNVSSE